MLRVLSLGAGVQSTTIALMASQGEFGDVPDCAIFADTGWEPKSVYEHLRWLRSPGVLSFPVHIVSAGSNIRSDLILRKDPKGPEGRFVTAPFFMLNADGSKGMGRRQCTTHYKIEPIRRKVRELLGKSARQSIRPNSVEMWIGISVDEIIRATPARVKFMTNRFPLLEKGMFRNDCILWLRKRGFAKPPKSSCIGCPFHNDAFWKDMRENRPDEWLDAVEVDTAIRNPKGWRKAKQFMHSQRVPLDEVDLSRAKDIEQDNGLLTECEGMCGV